MTRKGLNMSKLYRTYRACKNKVKKKLKDNKIVVTEKVKQAVCIQQ